MRQVLPDAVLIDPLDEVMYHDLLVDIGLFRNLVSKSKRGDWIVVDERPYIATLTFTFVRQFVQKH
ncbi:MAG: hypothetical protein F4Z66_09260 [Gammaproteobacteria bacterium]|nr:hypothetical protein [Gammaproteobacteria bacterium]